MRKIITEVPPQEELNLAGLSRASVLLGIDGVHLPLTATFKTVSPNVFSFNGLAVISPSGTFARGELDYNLNIGWLEPI